MKLEAASISDIGLVRKSNQDSVGCFPELFLFIVADGMGGLAGGERASRKAVQSVHAFFTWPPSETAATNGKESQLQEAIDFANRQILAEHRLEDGRATSGSTIVVLNLSLELGRAFWAHVGDSRLYRVRHGRLALLTADHTSPGAAYQDQSVIPLSLPHTNLLVQALGLRDDVEISTASDELRPGDLFLLCSDGISGLVDPATLERELTSAQPLDEKARSLVRLALSASGKDNASAVLVQVVGG